jgi:hypothetical protein
LTTSAPINGNAGSPQARRYPWKIAGQVNASRRKRP